MVWVVFLRLVSFTKNLHRQVTVRLFLWLGLSKETVIDLVVRRTDALFGGLQIE